MALTLILETGTGTAGANSYASVEECDAYHAGHLYPEAWTAATPERKATALVMATRTINNNFDFHGWKMGEGQTLEWPRRLVPHRGLGQPGSIGYGMRAGAYYAENALPDILKQATCEMARELLAANRTQDDPTKGIASLGLGQGAVALSFNPSDRKGALTDEVLRLLEPLGTPRGGKSGQIRVQRVQ